MYYVSESAVNLQCIVKCLRLWFLLLLNIHELHSRRVNHYKDDYFNVFILDTALTWGKTAIKSFNWETLLLSFNYKE